MRSGTGVSRPPEVAHVSSIGGAEKSDPTAGHPSPPMNKPSAWTSSASYIGQYDVEAYWRLKAGYNVRMFNIPGDEAALEEIMARSNKKDPEIEVMQRERRFHEASGKFCVYLEWREIEYLTVVEKIQK